MKIAGHPAEFVPRQPKVNVSRFDLADLDTRSARPIFFDTPYDVATFAQSFSVSDAAPLPSTCRTIRPASSCFLPDQSVIAAFSLVGKIALSEFAIRRPQTASNLFTARLETCIIRPVFVTVKTWPDFLKYAVLVSVCVHVFNLQWIKTVDNAYFQCS